MIFKIIGVLPIVGILWYQYNEASLCVKAGGEAVSTRMGIKCFEKDSNIDIHSENKKE
jgi:hypothetical protein